MTDQTTPIEQLSDLHDVLPYFKRQAAKGSAVFATGVSQLEALIAEFEADILSTYPAVETLTAYTLRVLRESPAAPVAEPTERLATLLDAAQRRETGALSAYYELEADILAAYPAVETAQPDIVARLEDSPISHAETSTLMREAAAEIRRLSAALAKAETERDHYLHSLNEHARNVPWNTATSREEAEAIAERYALAKADKFNLYAE